MPIFIQYEGISGDVTAVGHKGSIEAQSVQWSVNTVRSSGAQPAELIITKFRDSSSPLLLRAITMGFGAAVTISFVKEDSRDGKPYLTITLEDVIISNYSVAGNSGVDGKVMETLSVTFTNVEFLVRNGADLSKSDRAELQMKKAHSAP